jgi:four helix bundle protein
MGARRFDDLRAWQLAAELSDRVVALCATKPLQTDVKFRYQLQDAAEAAPRLIAEGFGRWSHRDFARYLVMARSEVMEVSSDLMALRRRQTIDVGVADDLIALADRTTRTINRLRSSL